MLNQPVLTVDLSAIAENYRLLRARFRGGECAGVVKANAYGLGMEKVAPALAAAGCRQFFVATLEEGVQLRALMPQAAIGVFHGPYAGEEKDYLAHGLTPVINHPGQWERWRSLHAPFMLHFDSGMNRLGFTLAGLEQLAGQARPTLLLSHLACGSEPEHPLTRLQLANFKAARALFPNARASLCNSSGIFLSPDYHFDLARPGCALYGINPTEGKNPMRAVARLEAPIIQTRMLDADGTVGYGATFTAPRGARIAIVQIGYADGLMRILSNRGMAHVGGHAAAFAGRVSMDMIALDVSGLPDEALSAGTAELLNERQTVDDLADACGTIGYEIFTRLGTRIIRKYNN